jgi:hypothetical protein
VDACSIEDILRAHARTMNKCGVPWPALLGMQMMDVACRDGIDNGVMHRDTHMCTDECPRPA